MADVLYSRLRIVPVDRCNAAKSIDAIQAAITQRAELMCIISDGGAGLLPADRELWLFREMRQLADDGRLTVGPAPHLKLVDYCND